MSNSGSIEFIVRGIQGEEAISPTNIPLPLLSTFSKDIESILSSIPDIKKEDVIVSIEKSSFKIKTFIALAAFNVFKADLDTLNSTNDLNSINDKRSKVIEDWISKSKSYPGLEFEIIPSGSTGIKINSESQIKRIETDIWVESELFLYGIITDLGGASKPNIHLKSENGSTLTIDCDKKDLESETENRVYKSSAIRVIANQNILSGEIKDAKFVSFEEFDETFDEEAFLESIEKGRNAWSNVSDHVEWVRNLRTDYE